METDGRKTKTLRIPLVYVKDKQAFEKSGGTLKLLGKITELARKWKKEGIELIHIVDMDAERGSSANFDIYDQLTYFMHVEVEGAGYDKLMKRLLGVDVRVVVPVPSKIDLKKYAEKKRLIVGKVEKIEGGKGAYDDVFDIIYSGASSEELEKLLKTGKRIIVDGELKTKNEKKLFGRILPISKIL
jgi:hypothetical protein